MPETHDDAVTTAEDTPLDIAAPAHGQVSLNADGSFRYVPVTGDGSASTSEDTPLTLDLLAGIDADVPREGSRL